MILAAILLTTTFSLPIVVEKAAPPEAPYDIYGCNNNGVLEQMKATPKGELWVVFPGGRVEERVLNTGQFRCKQETK